MVVVLDLLVDYTIHIIFARIFFMIFSIAFSFGRYRHWRLASPWLVGTNPRDSLMPKDGDDGFFPTTGNELVSTFH